MFVCLYVCMSQTLIRFKSMNSSVNSFPEWQKLLDIHESNLDFKNLIQSLAKWLKTQKKQKNEFKKKIIKSLAKWLKNEIKNFSVLDLIQWIHWWFSQKNPNNKNEWYFQKICKYFKWICL